MLLTHGADRRVRDNIGSTCLHAAAQAGEINMIQHLITTHHDINARNIHGATPLHSAASEKQGEALLVLLQAGADKTLLNNNGQSPYQVYLMRRGQDDPNVIKELIL